VPSKKSYFKSKIHVEFKKSSVLEVTIKANIKNTKIKVAEDTKGKALRCKIKCPRTRSVAHSVTLLLAYRSLKGNLFFILILALASRAKVEREETAESSVNTGLYDLHSS
jgi:hypothetical protein